MKKRRYIGALIMIYLIVSSVKRLYQWRRYALEDRLIEMSRFEQVDPEPFDEDISFDDRKCKKKLTNIAFLKTHKTGGSTITSILNRFADINHLDIALPFEDTRFNWPHSFKHSDVDITRLKRKRANILCNHLVLDRKELFKIMKPDYKLITVLRNPVDQIYSLFHFENFTKIYNLQDEENPVEAFFQNTSRHYRQFKSRIYPELFHKEYLLKNGMAFDLNFERFQKRQVDNSFDHFVEYIEKSFHLVLITELFDEGLLLLKRLLCWDLMDIVYEKKLVSRVKKKELSLKTVKKINEEWSNLDFRIYEYFKKKLLDLLEKNNRYKINGEVSRFKELNNLVSIYCQNTTQTNHREVMDYLQEIHEDIPAEFRNKPKCFCAKLGKAEIPYVYYFRKRFPTYYYLWKIKPKTQEGC